MQPQMHWDELAGNGDSETEMGQQCMECEGKHCGKALAQHTRPRKHSIMNRLAAGSGNWRKAFDCFKLSNSGVG